MTIFKVIRVGQFDQGREVAEVYVGFELVGKILKEADMWRAFKLHGDGGVYYKDMNRAAEALVERVWSGRREEVHLDWEAG